MLPLMHAPHADLSAIKTWVFDLDHTLYRVDPRTHAVMSERICLFLQRTLDLPRDAAFALQKRYLEQYGSTFAGLLRHHTIDSERYHAFVNDLDLLGLQESDDLRQGIARLKGQRLIFTNNCGQYAAQVLTRLGVADLFHAIIDARTMGAQPKPHPCAYQHIATSPATTAFFDDSLRNLKPAHALGITTIWCRTGPQSFTEPLAERPAYVHYETEDLPRFLHTIRTGQ
ncbi:MAG: pyrimidine 5'-nucleotidase [Alphaproteobacteria bacterium]|nr:pyrimidine 5'-nucleotidase [Alphaproteobacteria bacterium]